MKFDCDDNLHRHNDNLIYLQMYLIQYLSNRKEVNYRMGHIQIDVIEIFIET